MQDVTRKQHPMQICQSNVRQKLETILCRQFYQQIVLENFASAVWLISKFTDLKVAHAPLKKSVFFDPRLISIICGQSCVKNVGKF